MCLEGAKRVTISAFWVIYTDKSLRTKMQIFVSEVKYWTWLCRLCARNSIPKTKSPMNLDDDSRRQWLSESDSKTDPPWGGGMGRLRKNIPLFPTGPTIDWYITGLLVIQSESVVERSFVRYLLGNVKWTWLIVRINSHWVFKQNDGKRQFITTYSFKF